jgi:hypothetical protein
MMGGLACQVERNAALAFSAIPSDPQQFPEFDRQLRACFKLYHIVEGVVANGTAMACCTILWDQDWTLAQRTQLYDYLEELW